MIETPNKKAYSFRLTDETNDLLNYTLNNANFPNRTKLVETSIIQFCNFLNHCQIENDKIDKAAQDVVI